MTKKLTAMILALLIAFSAINIAMITVSAEGTDELISISTSDEATKDEATEDEAEILITGDINIDLEAINGRAIGFIGDVDLSGKVNIKDASNIQKYMAKLMTFSEKNKALADTDVSGKINIKDATAIQKYLAKLSADKKVMYLMYETGTHVHNYVAEVIDPTCRDDGYTVHSCICGDEYHENVTPAIGHNYIHSIVKPTCVKDGYTLYTCKNCGQHFENAQVPATGKHNFENGICAECGLYKTDYSFDILAKNIKNFGDYDSNENSYYYPLDFVYAGDEAYLVYLPENNAIGLAYILNEGGYTDILTMAFARGESVFEFFILCEDAFQATGVLEKQEFTKDITHIKGMEIYYLDDNSEEAVTHYCAGFLHTVFSVYADNCKNHWALVSLQDLGFTNY